jgi:hypothetical protein
MLSLFNSHGQFKKPAGAYRTFGNEFLIYEVHDFEQMGKSATDSYLHRLCIVTARPSKRLQQDLQEMIEGVGFSNYIIVDVLV